MTTIYELFKDKAVKDCDSVVDFLNKYYKPERFTGRGEEYAKNLIASYEKDVKNDGCTIISHHDSKTGEVVAYYPKEN